MRQLQKPLPPLVGRLLPRRAPRARRPELLSISRLGACAERSVGTPARLPEPVPEGTDAPKSCVNPSFADGWLSLPPRFHTSQQPRELAAPSIWVQAGRFHRKTKAPHIPHLTPWPSHLPLGN
jgi:hypothetical protein